MQVRGSIASRFDSERSSRRRISTVREERHGDGIRHLSVEYRTAFKLSKALREQDPPLCVTDKVATVWLQKYAHRGEVRFVQNAGHLETLCGDRIRSDGPSDATADALAAWLLKELAVSAPRTVCQTFFVSHLEFFGPYHDERCS